MKRRISKEVRGINRNIKFLTPYNNPTMCRWIEEYLRRIKKINTTIKYYTVTFKGDPDSIFVFNHKSYRLIVYKDDCTCYDLTLYNFKKFCRINKLSSNKNLIVK